ncbi:RNA-binding protein 41 [Trichomycterus rosablanca]|uniref:RNA-binding protein 41 n=1 Tax=Trichomycterus rosablanca TaxID=2290929 RepID=UPI002F35BFCA
MKRVTHQVCDDGPVPVEQETEGQRQLHTLLLQQLDTDVNIDRCVAKKKCFAPAAVYKPFGEQAAGVRSLAQFQALQDGEKELASLRELGLTETEIELWRNRNLPVSGGKNRGVCAAPEARDNRLQVIRDKMSVREELLSRPQRFSGSRALSRREMEIEKALFHGSDRSSFLTALYHQEENSQNDQQGETPANSMDSLYRDFLTDQQRTTVTDPCSSHQEPLNKADLLPATESHQTPINTIQSSINDVSSSVISTHNQTKDENQGKHSSLFVPKKITVSQTIGSLTVTSSQCQKGPVTVSGSIEEISDEEIRNNRETEDGIRKIPRFQNYQFGEPSNVLCIKNLSHQASLAQLVSLFSRFQKDETNPIVYRLLTGRLKGQAFITFSDIETAQAALDMVNGYRLLGKPLVIEFGREKRQAKSQDSSAEHSTNSPQKAVQNSKD